MDNFYRLRDVGVQSLSNEELIQLLLDDPVLSKEVIGLGIHNLHSLYLEEVERAIPTKSAVKLLAAVELGRRISSSPKSRTKILKPSDAIGILLEDMRYLKKEYFKILMINTSMEAIALETVSIGTLDSTIVHPREALGPALRRSAAYVILAHNHPSGNPTPSEADINATARLMVAGEVLGIEILDHIVVGDGTYVSFRDQKILFK